MDSTERLSFMVKASLAGGNAALAKHGCLLVVMDDGGGSLTTAQDAVTQEIVMKMPCEHDPDMNLIGEEALDKRMTADAYVIDPIDGSVNYSRDGRDWCCTVAHKRGDDIDAGVIWQPRTRTMASATREGLLKIEENGDALTVPPPPAGRIDFSRCIVAAPLTSYFSDEVITRVFVPLLKSTRFVQHGGSNTGGIISLLLGHIDVFIGWGSLWDFAAGKLFVEMMGGTCATFHGEPIDVNVIAPQRVVFARSKALLDAILPFTREWPIEREKRQP